ncbi:MAG: hypothetical protein GC202_02375 [Alphaproteobacteria bacterium]|nr:hypothetical protein [Alphaproteobacteria bacterium]
MDILYWAVDEVWPLALGSAFVVYLFRVVRMADREPGGPPERPEKLTGYDVEWCANCSNWVPAKTPWCGIRGCARPHRTL